MSETVNVPGTKYERAAELERVFLDALLAEAGFFRFLAPFPVLFAEQMEDIRLFEIHRLVGLALFVNQKWEGDPGLLDESASEDEIAQADSGQVDSALLELRLVGAQLRDVLTAEDSTVMAEEHDDRRPVRPEQVELDGTFVRIWQDDSGEALGIGAGHAKRL